jgi:CheY-like chemotaxis protein
MCFARPRPNFGNNREIFVPAQTIKADEGMMPENWHKAGLNILVAEDNLANQRLILALLAHCGHRVVVVDDGEQAVNAVRAQNFDVVLMDIHMPNVDGLMATRQIRAMSGPVANLPIVAVTANEMNADRDAYIAHGLTGFVAKPIDPLILMAEIEAAIASYLPTETYVDMSDQTAPDIISADRESVHSAGSIDAVPLYGK